MSTKWTADLIRQMRDLAAAGHMSKEASVLLKAPLISVKVYATKHGITFSAGSKVDIDIVPDDLDWPSATEMVEAAKRLAQAELRRQIALAKREVATSPPYEGWRA
jgi:hypothetical protein